MFIGVISVIFIIYRKPAVAQQNIAQLMAERGLAKIITPAARKNIRADIETVIKEYDSAGNSKKPKKQNERLSGELELNGIKIGYLYQTLANRKIFFIDEQNSAAVIDGTSYAIIKFRPKENLHIQRIADQFINRTTGSVYVNLDNMSISKIEGSIEEPFHFNYTLIFFPIGVDVYRFSFLVEYAPFEDVFVEKTLNGLADYEIRKRGTKEYFNQITNYRRK